MSCGQVPPRIADLGLEPGALSFACVVGDHALCDGCAACACHGPAIAPRTDAGAG